MNIKAQHQHVYDLFSKYYEDLVLTKVKTTPDSNYALWYAKSCSMLCLENKYIIVITENNYDAIGTLRNLTELEWHSFQTRTINQPIGIKLSNKTFKTTVLPDMHDSISLIHQKPDRYIYTTKRLPLQVELMLTRDETLYSERGTLESALNTYNCVVTFVI